MRAVQLLPVFTLALTLGCAAPSVHRRAAEEVVWRSLTAPDAAERREATRVAVEVADPVLSEGLAQRLGDPDPTVRALAACALLPEVPEARELLRASLSSADPAARVAALDGVGALGDGVTQAARLTTDPDQSVRARAAWMLAVLRAAEAAEYLERLLGDPAPGVRAEALRALASVTVERAAAHAESALSDAALSVRLAGLTTLARAAADHSQFRDRLLALAGGADRFVALRAAVHLDRLGADALAAVENAAADRHAAVRAAAMNAAGELRERGRALALAHLGDGDLEVRLAAARALLASGGDSGRARSVFRAALATPFRLEAADELARLGDAEGRRAVAFATHDADATIRRSAVASLGALSPEAPELGEALADRDAAVRLTAARTLLRRALRPYLR